MDAALAYDRAAFNGGRPKKLLNFPNLDHGTREESDEESDEESRTKKTKLRSTNTTGFKGVSKQGHKFRAQIKIVRETKSLGTFDTASAAGLAWDRAAIKEGRPSSDLNFPDVEHDDDSDDSDEVARKRENQAAEQGLVRVVVGLGSHEPA